LVSMASYLQIVSGGLSRYGTEMPLVA
jgi:hypothetical protein